MRDYLAFLKEYEVQSKLNLDMFLQKANLTKRETAYLREHLCEIELMYKVTFQGKGEILVFRARLRKWDSEYIENTIASMIASSMPYDVVIGVQNGDAIKFVVTDRRDNKLDSRKSIMEKVCTFPSVLPGRNSDLDIEVQNCLKTAFLSSESPKEVITRLKSAYKILWKKQRKNHLDRLIDLGIVEMDYDSSGPTYYIRHDSEVDVAFEIQDADYLKMIRKDDWKITGE